MAKNKEALKAFGYLMAANGQAVLLVGLAFELVSYLKEHYLSTFPWHYVVWPACVLVIGHSYYLVGRRIIELDEKRKKP